MSKLPMISGQDCVVVLSKVGYFLKRQKGSHLILRRNDPYGQLVVPNHSQLDRGMLRAIIRQSGLSISEFIELL